MKILKDIFFLLSLLVVRRLPQDRAIILMYHSIADRPEHFNSVSPVNFELQMRYLKDAQIPVISLRELVRRLAANEPLGGAIVFTFDDGFRNNLTDAYPVLRKYNFPATIFSVSDHMKNQNEDGIEQLSLEELRKLQRTGLIDIEAHTKTHPHLPQISKEEQLEEVVGSKMALEKAIEKKITLFAYPYGQFNDDSVAIVRNSGFEAAVTVSEGTVSPRADMFRLPRVSIDRSTSQVQFRGKVSGAVDLYESLKHMFRV